MSLSMQPREFVVLAIALLAVARPDLIAQFWNGPRQKRLDQLRNGAEERYFEERRALEAYPIRHLWTVRVLGAVFLLIETGRAFL